MTACSPLKFAAHGPYRAAAWILLALVGAWSPPVRGDETQPRRVVTVTGTLENAAIPPTYKLEQTILIIKPLAWKTEVNAIGDCRDAAGRATPPRAELAVSGNCRQVAALHVMPDRFGISDDRAVYSDGGEWYVIGRVTGIGRHKWVVLANGASIQATRDSASLVLDLSRLRRP